MSGLQDEITNQHPDERESAGTSDSEETSVPSDPREGKQFGAYRVLRRLGSGGMGHVYLALDTRLGRHTALKFLPQDLLREQDALHRLEQEARTASALNHPSILTIYEIGESQGELFIASEFVEGVTLKKAIQRGTLDPEMAIRVVTQIASALMAAHSAGVIHRDLKPANVMLRPDGYVKVIDFGLAKLTEESSLNGLKRSGLSFTGSVVGTVDYMSPEQARGEDVAANTDLWSLGVVFYEMLSGRRPFKGETESHVIVAILDRPAAPLNNLASFPRGVGRILDRALKKDPAERYQSAEQLLVDLEQIDVSSVRRQPIRSGARRRVRPYHLALASLVLLSAASSVWWWGLGGRYKVLEPDWFRIDSVQQITSNERIQLAAISPDGKYLAFIVGDRGGTQSLHLKQLDQPWDDDRIPSRKIDYIGLTFSPDSRAIYEVEEEQATLVGKLYTVPIVGERSRLPLVDNIDGPVTFSPAGERFAFVRWESPSALHPASTKNSILISARDGSSLIPLVSTWDFRIFRQLAWSPEGNRIAAVVHQTSLPRDQLSIDLFGLNKHTEARPLPNWNNVSQISWERKTNMVLLSAASGTEADNRQQIREVDLNSGKIHEVTKDLNGYRSLSATEDGQHIAAVRIDLRARLWVSNVNDFRHGRISPLEAQSKASLGWLNESDLVVNSRLTGYPNTAIFTTKDYSEASLTNEPFIEQHAVPVPGAQAIVFSSNRSGRFHIWRYDLPTNEYTQLTFGSSYDDVPAVSPDGQWVVYASSITSEPALYRVPVHGGATARVTDLLATDPQFSPDGKWIACVARVKPPSDWSTLVISFDGAQPSRIVPKSQEPFRWSPSGDSLTSALTDENGVSNLWQIPLDGSSPVQLTNFEDQTISSLAWSPSGDRVACIRLTLGSDAVLINRQKPR